jgi:hypothetical protein
MKRKGVLEKRLHRVELELERQSLTAQLSHLNASRKAKHHTASSPKPIAGCRAKDHTVMKSKERSEHGVDIRITKLFKVAVKNKYGDLKARSPAVGSIPLVRQREESMKRGVSMKLKNDQHKQARHARQDHRPPPPLAGAFKARTSKEGSTTMPRRYKRNEFPFKIGHKGQCVQIEWTCPLANVNIYRLLPLLFEGLREVEPPFNTLANQGIIQCCKVAHLYHKSLAQAVPGVIHDIRRALATRQKRVITQTLLRMQDMMRVDKQAGVAFMGYYRQLFVIFNLFITNRRNIGDDIEYGQRNHVDVGALVLQTLEMLEHCAGPVASAKIKYMVPTYEPQFYSA